MANANAATAIIVLSGFIELWMQRVVSAYTVGRNLNRSGKAAQKPGVPKGVG